MSAKDVKTNRITDTQDHISQEAVNSSAAKLIPRGAVVIVARSGILRHSLPVAVLDVEATVNQDLKALLPAPGFQPEYVAWALRRFASNILDTCAKDGTTVQSIEFDRFKEFAIPLAPATEQRRIVDAIEEQFSRLDAAETYLHRAETNLLKFRSAVVSEGTKGDWPELTIEELTASDRRSAYGVLQPGRDVEGGVPLVRVRDIVEGSIRTTDLKRIDPVIAERYPRTRLVGGEVVLTIVGTVGRTAVVPDSLAGANVARAVAVIPLGSSVSAQFVSLVLSSPRAVAQLVGLAHEVARKTLNLEDVREFKIAIPRREEQDNIVLATATQMSIADAALMQVRTALAKALAARRAVLHEAFAGRLVPSLAESGFSENAGV